MEVENAIEETVEETALETESPEEQTNESLTDLEVSGDEYTPDLTYKIKDEEHTFDERLHGAIKTKEDEEFLRDLVTGRAGLDSYKEKLNSRNSEYDELLNNAENLHGGYERIKELRDAGDYRKLLFENMGMNKEQILDFAYELAEEMELPEEERIAAENARKEQTRVQSLEIELENYKERQSAQLKEFQSNQLDTLVASEDARSVSELLAQNGTSLREEVISYGRNETRNTGVEPGVDEVFNAVLDKFKGFIPKQEPIQTEGLPQATVIERPSTLPNVNGGATAGVAPKITSFEELKAMAAKIH